MQACSSSVWYCASETQRIQRHTSRWQLMQDGTLSAKRKDGRCELSMGKREVHLLCSCQVHMNATAQCALQVCRCKPTPAPNKRHHLGCMQATFGRAIDSDTGPTVQAAVLMELESIGSDRTQWMRTGSPASADGRCHHTCRAAACSSRCFSRCISSCWSWSGIPVALLDAECNMLQSSCMGTGAGGSAGDWNTNPA